MGCCTGLFIGAAVGKMTDFFEGVFVGTRTLCMIGAPDGVIGFLVGALGLIVGVRIVRMFGAAVGFLLGTLVGNALGFLLGTPEGKLIGFLVGDFALFVGANVGFGIGGVTGFRIDGFRVGLALGRMVGLPFMFREGTTGL